MNSCISILGIFLVYFGLCYADRYEFLNNWITIAGTEYTVPVNPSHTTPPLFENGVGTFLCNATVPFTSRAIALKDGNGYDILKLGLYLRIYRNGTTPSYSFEPYLLDQFVDQSNPADCTADPVECSQEWRTSNLKTFDLLDALPAHKTHQTGLILEGTYIIEAQYSIFTRTNGNETEFKYPSFFGSFNFANCANPPPPNKNDSCNPNNYQKTPSFSIPNESLNSQVKLVVYNPYQKIKVTHLTGIPSLKVGAISSDKLDAVTVESSYSSQENLVTVVVKDAHLPIPGDGGNKDLSSSSTLFPTLFLLLGSLFMNGVSSKTLLFGTLLLTMGHVAFSEEAKRVPFECDIDAEIVITLPDYEIVPTTAAPITVPAPTSPPGTGKPPLDGCQIFSNNQCQGDDVATPDIYEASRWWTPRPGDSAYKSSYGDYWRLVGNAHVTYNAARTQATVEVKLIHKDKLQSFTYYFGSDSQSTPTKTFDSTFSQVLTVKAVGSDGSVLELPPIDFVWNAPAVTQPSSFMNGQKGAIVELFGWPHSEVALECPALGKMGYLGVKVFPAMEQVMSSQPFNGILNPWYFMYQPVSYRLDGRMGTREELRDMIKTCRQHGVRVYADAVINHMTGSGNDANPNHRYPQGCPHWGAKDTSSNSPSPFYTQGFSYTYNPYTGEPPSQEYPAVPFGPTDFHCERALSSWTSPVNMNAGWLSGLVDLNTEKDNVQERIADYLTDLIGIGFSGFRVDAAKHIKPDDLIGIFSKLKRNLGGTLPPDFITWWEILLGGEADLLMCNVNSGYNYGPYLTNGLTSAGFTNDDIKKIKIWNSGYPKEPYANCNNDKWREVIQNDDHDQQNPGSSSRDMGNTGCVLIKDCSSDEHRNFEISLFSQPAGISNTNNLWPIRTILSSFYFGSDGSTVGIPDGKSDCSKCELTCEGCKSLPYVKAHNPNSCGYDTGSGQYTRVHRNRSIILAMRQWMGLSTSVSNADLGLPAGCS